MRFLFSMAVALSAAMVNVQALDVASGSQSNIDNECYFKGRHKCERFDYKPAEISAYSTGVFQFIFSGTGFNPVIFEAVQSSAQNIEFALSGEASQFKVLLDGTYEIEWSLCLANSGEDDVVRLQLLNNTTGFSYLPITAVNVPRTADSTAGFNVSGSIIVNLAAGTVVSLQASSSFGTPSDPTHINSPTINIKKIAW
jgi:hypothetical protein